MMLVCTMQMIYIIDYFLYERFLVSTWDIAFEHLGFMLVWGCYVWVPFFCMTSPPSSSPSKLSPPFLLLSYPPTFASFPLVPPHYLIHSRIDCLQTWFLFDPTGTEMSEFHVAVTIITFIVGFAVSIPFLFHFSFETRWGAVECGEV